MDPILFDRRRKASAPMDPASIGGLFAPAPVPVPTEAATPRAKARREAEAKAPSKKARIRAAIMGASRPGITRLELARVTGFLRDTINARVREILDEQNGIVEHGTRGDESVLMWEGYAR